MDRDPERTTSENRSRSVSHSIEGSPKDTRRWRTKGISDHSETLDSKNDITLSSLTTGMVWGVKGWGGPRGDNVRVTGCCLGGNRRFDGRYGGRKDVRDLCCNSLDSSRSGLELELLEFVLR